MSFGILWPSMLTTIGEDSVFWVPTVNDNMRIVNDALSPAVVELITDEVLRPSRVVTWTRDIGVYRVHSADIGIGIAGVVVGHTKDTGRVLVKTYGVAVVDVSHDVSAADIGKIAVFAAGGVVALTGAPTLSRDHWVGVVVGIVRSRTVAILLRYYGDYATPGTAAYTRNPQRQYGPISAGAVVPDVAAGQSAYSESSLFFTYLGTYDDDHPELYNTAVLGVNTGAGSCGNAVNFDVSGGFVVQGTSGATMTLHLTHGYSVAVGRAVLIDTAEDGGTGLRVHCDVQGQVVTLVLGSGTWQGQGTKQVHVSVTGILTEG